MLHVARAVADQVFIPFTVGGGIRTGVEDMRQMLRAGADKVGINSAAVRTPQLITDGAMSLAHRQSLWRSMRVVFRPKDAPTGSTQVTALPNPDWLADDSPPT